MTEVLKWVTAVLAIWGAVSILAAVFWALVGRRIFRKPPQPPTHLVMKTELPPEEATADFIEQFKRLHGRGGER